MNLDTNRILNTDEKVLANALVELAKSGNTIDAAKKYKTLYKDQPLSFIIENSERIFVEPRQGLDFYREMIPSFPLFVLCDELTKVTNYIHDHKDEMHPMLAQDYGRVADRLRGRIHDTNCFGVIEDVILSKDPSNRAKIMTLCDLLTRAGDDYQNARSDNEAYYDRDRKAINAFNDMNTLVKSLDPVISLIYLSVSPRKGMLRYCARNIAKSLDSGVLRKTMESAIYVGYFSGSELFQEAVREIPSMDARCVFEGLGDTDVISEFDTYAEKAMDVEDTTSLEVTLDNFIDSAYLSLQEEKADAEDNALKRNALMEDKLTMYEAVLNIVKAIYEQCESTDTMEEFPIFTTIKEAAGVTGEVTVEDALKIITEATSGVESEMDSSEVMEEYTIDGRPGAVISRHSAGTRYNEDIKHGVNNHPKAAAPTKSGALDDEDENSEMIPSSSRYSGSTGLPDSSDPNAKRPVKPKTGALDKITNKAMDANAAGKHRASKLKAAGQGVANAGKAVLKVPAGILKGLGGLTKALDTMDDNRRKEFMIRPGFRKKIFKNLRVAAMYGATAYVNKLYLPITWFARKMSKEKNKRIRNEFAAELETEIKVTEAKIEDATSKGDQEQRYQLIRIKDKLVRDLDRVKYNAKYL